jgi:hypothetical protein
MSYFETEKAAKEEAFRRSLLKLLFQFWFLLYVLVLWSVNKYTANEDLRKLRDEVQAFYRHEGYL